jgi:hypothetical protein
MTYDDYSDMPPVAPAVAVVVEWNGWQDRGQSKFIRMMTGTYSGSSEDYDESDTDNSD